MRRTLRRWIAFPSATGLQTSRGRILLLPSCRYLLLPSGRCSQSARVIGRRRHRSKRCAARRLPRRKAGKSEGVALGVAWAVKQGWSRCVGTGRRGDSGPLLKESQAFPAVWCLRIGAILALVALLHSLPAAVAAGGGEEKGGCAMGLLDCETIVSWHWWSSCCRVGEAAVPGPGRQLPTKHVPFELCGAWFASRANVMRHLRQRV